MLRLSLPIVLVRFLWLLLLLGAVAVAADEVPVPPLKARVTDLTATLSAAQAQSLEAKLQTFEAAKGSQIAVLLVPTTRPESIEQYGIRVAEQWKLGRKGVDDGLLLLVAKDDRELRIEVGYGLEGVVSDAVAKRVISDVIVPYFQAGNFSGGIEAGVNALIKLVSGEPLPDARAPSGDETGGSNSPDMFFVVFGAALVGGIVLRRVFGRMVGAAVGGVGAFLGFWLVLGILPIAAFMGVFCFLFLLADSRGGWGGGDGFGGGGGGFSGGGGGGFSGGGGGFGGGGASGRW